MAATIALIATKICTLRKVAATCIAINEKNSTEKQYCCLKFTQSTLFSSCTITISVASIIVANPARAIGCTATSWTHHIIATSLGVAVVRNITTTRVPVLSWTKFITATYLSVKSVRDFTTTRCAVSSPIYFSITTYFSETIIRCTPTTTSVIIPLT